jgi:hypothetical protein
MGGVMEAPISRHVEGLISGDSDRGCSEEQRHLFRGMAGLSRGSLDQRLFRGMGAPIPGHGGRYPRDLDERPF